jgi:hypothetical protein
MEGITLRRPDETDWPAILEVAHAAVPWARAGNEEWWHNRQQFDTARWTRRHWVAEEAETGRVVAYAAAEEGPKPGWYRLFLVMEPARLPELGATLYDWLQAELEAQAAVRAWVQEEVLDPVVAFFRARGYEEYRRFTLESGRGAVIVFCDLA